MAIHSFSLCTVYIFFVVCYYFLLFGYPVENIYKAFYLRYPRVWKLYIIFQHSVGCVLLKPQLIHVFNTETGFSTNTALFLCLNIYLDTYYKHPPPFFPLYIKYMCVYRLSKIKSYHTWWYCWCVFAKKKIKEFYVFFFITKRRVKSHQFIYLNTWSKKLFLICSIKITPYVLNFLCIYPFQQSTFLWLSQE